MNGLRSLTLLLSWTIPNWSEGRDLLGAIVEINDGVNFYDEFIGFPENNPLKAYAFTVPEPGPLMLLSVLWMSMEMKIAIVLKQFRPFLIIFHRIF